MSGKGGSAPEMPDFQALANQMAQYDWYSQQAALNANRPDIATPYGSVTWYRPGTQPPPWGSAGASGYVPSGWGVRPAPPPSPSTPGYGPGNYIVPGGPGYIGGGPNVRAAPTPNAMQRVNLGSWNWNDIVPGEEQGVWPAGFGVPFLLPGDVNQNPYAEGFYNDIVLPGGGGINFDPGGGVSSYDPQGLLNPYRTPSRETWDVYLKYLSAQSGIPYEEYYRAYENLKFNPEQMNWWQRGLLGQGVTIGAGVTPINPQGNTVPLPQPPSGGGVFGGGGGTGTSTGADWLQQRNGIWYNVNSANNKARPFSEPYPDQAAAARLAGRGGGTAPTPTPNTGGGGGTQPPPAGGGGGGDIHPGLPAGVVPGVWALPGGGSIQVNTDGSVSAYDPLNVLGGANNTENLSLLERWARYYRAHPELAGQNTGVPGQGGANGYDAPPGTLTPPWTPSGTTGNWAMRMTLPPMQQQALDVQNAIALSRSQLGYGLLGDATAELNQPVNYNMLPNWAATPIGWPVTMGLDFGSLPGMRDVGNLDVANTLSFGGAPGLTNTDTLRQNAENALYARQTSRLDPEWNQREERLRTQLLNQGLRPGSEAYDRSMQEFNRARTDAYQAARNESIMAGGEEAQRQFGMQLQARQQAVQESLQQAQYAYQAAVQEFEAAMQAGDYERAKRAQIQGEKAQQGVFANQAAAQEVDEQLRLATYQNQLRSGVLAEQLQRRGVAINEMNALLGGQQVDMPQMPGFQGMMQAGRPPDLLGAANSSYNAALQQYGMEQQQYANLLGGGMQLASLLPMLLAL